VWNVKVTPLIIGATGTVSKSFRKCPNNMRGEHAKRYSKELQKIIILGNAHITAECANVKVPNCHHGK
jgi:hypothetical protein